MKIERKGKKVHPSPPQTAVTPPQPVTHDSLSVLNLLPAAIFALVAALSFQDREVLAYMITRSLKTTTTASINTSSPSVVKEELKLKLKKTYSLHNHKSPVFDCECFECYTSFWYRWDSSANREVIHQAIEAFEEHLASGELEMKRNRRGKKKVKLPLPLPLPIQMIEIESPKPATIVNEKTVSEPSADRLVEVKPIVAMEDDEALDAVVMKASTGGHKGLARKVLPDVLGVFNSRLWNLWGPNV